MGSLTPEIRKRIIKAYKKGYRIKDIAAIFGVSWPLADRHQRTISSGWKASLRSDHRR